MSITDTPKPAVHSLFRPHPGSAETAQDPISQKGPARPLQQGLSEAVRASGLTGADGTPLHVVTHQLRHTFATALANAGMSIQALMALLGHYAGDRVKGWSVLGGLGLRRAQKRECAAAPSGLWRWSVTSRPAS